MHALNTWAVIPAYNEEKMIGKVVEGLKTVVPNIIVVDDCSRDATREVAEQSGAIVLRHRLNRDQGAALQTGMSYALMRGADIIVHFDADGQHCVEDIPSLTGPLHAGVCDVVLGSRFLRIDTHTTLPSKRKLFLKCAILFTYIFSGIRLSDTHNGLRAFSRSAAERICITERGKAHASEILHEIARLGLRVMEVPVTIRYTAYSLARGDSSIKRTIDVLRRLIWSKLLS